MIWLWEPPKEEIIENYGEEYSHTRQFKGKAKGAQEAHEAIRPTYISEHKAGMGADHERLYNLIWKRTIASQMSDAQLERTTITINPSGSKLNFVAKGEVVTFDGFFKVYLEGKDEEEEKPGRASFRQFRLVKSWIVSQLRPLNVSLNIHRDTLKLVW